MLSLAKFKRRIVFVSSISVLVSGCLALGLDEKFCNNYG
jgi:hypothetical protein